MKILEIKLKNLNSLRGEWKIDLTDSAYKSDGIFAVTGSTGAGKTTIFDALSLALYGQTPRLARINASTNEIMSRGTSECFAHVKFSTEEGVFVCKWWQTRTGGRPKGALQSANHHIEKYVEGQKEGKPLATQHTLTLNEVKRITGMDFRQFTQSVLLAQGEFDAFLNGTASERAKILELLTGTGIYSEISRRIASRTEREQNKLNEAKIKRDSAIPRDGLGTDEEISQNIDKTRELLKLAKESFKKSKEELDWLNLIRKINDELSQNQSAIEFQKSAIAKFTEDRVRLEAGLRAKNVLPVHRELSAKRKQCTANKSQCERTRSEIARASSELQSLESEMLPQYEQRLRQLIANLPEGKTPQEIRLDVFKHVKDFEENYNEKVKKEAERTKLEATLQKSQSKLAFARQQEDEARNKVSELLNIRVSAILDSERVKLKPGDVCPLCGSTIHSETLHRVSGNSRSDSRFDDELRAARDRENRASRASQEAQAERDKFEIELENCRKKIVECEEKKISLKSSILAIIEPIGILAAKNCDEIKNRVNKWCNETVSLNNLISAMREKIQELRGKVDANQKSFDALTSELSEIENELNELEKRFKLELNAQNFSDEKNFTDSMLSDYELSQLQAMAKSYDDKLTELQGIRDDRTRRLDEEMSKAVTTRTLEEAEPLYRENETKVDVLQRELIRFESAAESRKNLKSEFDRLDKEYQSQSEIYSNWSAFNKEIGSVGGGKFNSFAQKITLRAMIQLANEQLRRMNGRYTLTDEGSSDNGLELSVIDSEQSNEVRPTSNLSGGERFIISLALALGLSQISGAKAKVDSLFIDEGFGSLDDEALNSALEALGEIKSEGRMIGIISHVSGISERINAKINVIRKNEGTSILEGPGCSRGK